MRIQTFKRENGQEGYLLLDTDERVVELPTRFALALANRVGFKYSQRTVKEYLKVLKQFCEYLSKSKQRCPISLDLAFASVRSYTVEKWLKQMYNQGLSSATLRMRDTVLKIFMNWLTTQEAGRVRQPFDHPYSDGKLKTKRVSRPNPKPINYKKLCEFIREGLLNESERCLIHFMFDTGIRVSEVPRVLQADLPKSIDYPPEVMYFPLRIRGSKGRGGDTKERNTLISRPTLERLLRLHNNWKVYLRAKADYSHGKTPAFLNVLGQPMTAGAIQKRIYKASRRMLQKAVLQEYITPHLLRHSMAFSVLLSEHGRTISENMVVCQNLLGHESIKTTELYLGISLDVIVELQKHNCPDSFWKRYQEAEYIFEQSFKPQRDHLEHRGHGRRPLRSGRS